MFKVWHDLALYPNKSAGNIGRWYREIATAAKAASQ